jgi:hypothetical protein
MRYNTKGQPISENDPCYQEYGTYFEAHYSCSDCSYVFSVVSESKPKGRCPGCPKCKEEAAAKGVHVTKGKMKTNKQLLDNSEDMARSRKTPGIAGKSNLYKAHDATMKMVMEDYGLTDINDKPYEGENCVPKLPAHLEKQVNEGFGASFGAAPKLASNINPSVITSTGMKQINSGMFRNQGDVVAMQQKYGPKPKYNFINEKS